MTILTLSNAFLAYGHYPLLQDASMSLIAGERVGLIGRNGTGKSSMLKVVAGIIDLDKGRCTRQSGLSLEFVAQEPELPHDANVIDAITMAFEAQASVLLDFEHCSNQLAAGETHGADGCDLLEQFAHIQTAMEAGNVWQIRNRVDEIIKRFELDPHQAISALSGGQKKRVALARALVKEPDLLMLDEPTNHLDIGSIEWLEQALIGLPVTLLFITHDRSFLDKVATRILELDRGQLASFPGNFSAYELRKAEMLHAESQENARFDKLLAQEEVWIRKGVEARRTRNEGRVRRLQSLRRERGERINKSGSVQMAASKGELSGKLVAELKGVSKAFGEQAPLVRDFSTLIMRGDKVGLIGDNGVGKTTLLKTMLGLIPQTSGELRLGTNLQIGYFDQMRAALNDEATVVETISPGSEWIEINGQRKHVMSYLADFLFAPERARSPVKSLSGGERNRLLLARLFASPSNLLVLDEPTNDLDMDTLSLLEELLAQYEGTVILVSHDRQFLDNVVTQSIAHIGDGRWANVAGGYSTWLEQGASLREAAKSSNSLPQSELAEVPTPDARLAVAKQVKLSFKDQRQLDALPALISALETEQSAIAQELATGSVFAQDPARAQTILQRSSTIESELLVALEAWEQLEAKRA